MRTSTLLILCVALFATFAQARKSYRPASSSLSAKAFAYSSRNQAAPVARSPASSQAQDSSNSNARSPSTSGQTNLSPKSNQYTRYSGLASLPSSKRLGDRKSPFTLSSRRLPHSRRRTSYRGRKPQPSPFSYGPGQSTRSQLARPQSVRPAHRHGSRGSTQGSRHHQTGAASRVSLPSRSRVAPTQRPQYGALKEGKTGVFKFQGGNSRRNNRQGQAGSRRRAQTGTNSRINIESKITAPLPPKPHLETIIVGETAILHCSFENVVKIGQYRQAQIWWTKMPRTASGRAVVLASGSQVRIPDDRLKVVSFPDNGFSVLVIRNSMGEDSAEYKCSIPTVSGYRIGYQTLQVEAAPDSRVHSPEKEQVVEAGDDVPLFCLPNFDGVDSRELSVWWTAKGPTGTNLKLSGNQEKFLGQRFTVENIQKDMEGIYTCHVENPEGLPIRKHFSVVLKEAPWKIEAFKQNLNLDTMLSRYTKDAEVGDRMNLRCDSGGNPAPTVRWMKNGRQLNTQQDKIDVSEYTPSYRPNAVVSKLIVSNFQLLDQGRYTCIVENELGARERDFDVKVATRDSNRSSNRAPTAAGSRDSSRKSFLPDPDQETLYKYKGGKPQPVDTVEDGSGDGQDDDQSEDDFN